MGAYESHKIAVLIPCLNESIAIGEVVSCFRSELPHAAIVVFDNGSDDGTREIAVTSGATVVHVPLRGKGNVVAAMLERVDADVYVMVDGDDTYPAEKVHDLLAPVLMGKADMTVGARVSVSDNDAYRRFHVLGNTLVRCLINVIFNATLTDILSGYRAFNRRVAKTLPVVSAGFEVETEMTIQMLYHRLALVEVPVLYRSRPQGSVSKLHTFRDGIRVLWKLFSLVRACKPLTFFGGVGLVFIAAGVCVGISPVLDYLVFRYVYHVPMAILAVGLVNVGMGCIFLGILLHAVNWRFKELHNILGRRQNRGE